MTRVARAKVPETTGNSLEDKVCRTRESDFTEAFFRGPFEADCKRVTALDVDLNGGGYSVEQVVNDGTGHHAGSTRQSLTLDTPLVGPDRDVSTRDLLDEVGIGAVGEVAVVADMRSPFP